MRTIKAQKITADNFRIYGQYADFVNPDGVVLGDFYRDQVLMETSGRMNVAFSPLLIHKGDMVVKAAEYHNYTPETMMCMDDDMIVHLAPAGNGAWPEKTEAFIVPKGTMICINTGVWHFAPIPVNKETAHVMICLPERTYFNDCVVVDYKEEDWFQITVD